MQRGVSERFFRFAVLANYFALLALLPAMHALTPGGSGLATGIALALPLLAPLKGLWTRSAYTHRWASLLVIAYIAYGLVEVIANPGLRSWASGVLVIAFLLFVSLVTYLRGALIGADRSFDTPGS